MFLTRRQMLLSAAALTAGTTALGGLSACSTVRTNPAEAQDSSSPAAAAEPGALPVTLTHRYGQTTIETTPQRVVCVGLKEQDDLLSVGIVPVGASTWLTFPDGNTTLGPWARASLGSAPAPTTLDTKNGTAFEAVAALQPDLILALYAGTSEADYKKLSAIAKTVVAPSDYVDYGIPWDVQAEIVGRAVGRPQAMAERVAAAKQALADRAAANPAFAGQTAMVISQYEGIYVYGPQDPRVRLMNDLGFVNPEGFDDLFPASTTTFGGNISPERADILDVGALLCFADKGQQQAQIETQLFKTLDVHTQGRTVWMRTADDATPPFSFLTVLSLPYLLDKLIPRLVSAVDADAATTTEQPA